MPRWLVAVIVVGVILDLGISAFLVAQQQQVNANTTGLQTVAKKAKCYDAVFDKALTDHPTEASLRAKAQFCRKLP